ncbi:MAG: outer membrane beta-barrel protein [Proteobacteria bacterium]|nr:outer membrane beta-barrel protein [Pseudomonadota bacterium]NIS71815.1 outer membrane beta-barrel protein [Pseudomonadota bacterium]
MKKGNLIIVTLMGTLVLWNGSARAEGPFRQGATEWGFRSGYGDNFQVNNVEADVEFYFLKPFWGKILKTWEDRRSLEFVGEGFLSFVRQDSEDRYAGGLTGVIAYNIRLSEKWVPFVELGVGVLYTDLNPEGFGSHFNFTPQGGVGVRYKVLEGRYLTFSYRLHHISNAGLDEDNSSIDSHFFSIGLSFFR